MKKIVSALAILLLVCLVLTTLASCKTEETDSLVIYNWADYIFDDKLTDFKEYYRDITGKNIDITYVTFDTNETMLTRLTKGDSNVDVVCPSEYAIQKLIELDMLVPMHYFDEQAYTEDFSSNVRLAPDGDEVYYIHNSGNVEQGIIDKVSDAFGSIEITAEGSNQHKKVSMVDYFVPYMYGTLGILYNKYAFKELGIYDEEILNRANWGILFNDDGQGGLLSEGLTGSILMKDSIRDSYAATVFYLLESGKLDGLKNDDGVAYADMPVGDLINAVDDQLLALVKDALTEQKTHLFGYEVDFGKDDLLTGNAMVDLAWSGDAMYAVEESWNDSLGDEGDYELSYYVPHSTGNIWFDGWVVPKTRNPAHTDAIKLFINYLNRPDVAAANLLEIGYSASVKSDVIKSDEAARAVLAEGYAVYAPELWDAADEDGNPLSQEDCDFADWEEFELYFFHNSYLDDDGNLVSYDEISNSNWRYPFESAATNTDNYRNIDSLGVMRDFGTKNKAVVTAWNYSRSAGVNALPLLGWTALAVAVAVGAVYLVIYIKRVVRQNVKIPQKNKPDDSGSEQ